MADWAYAVGHEFAVKRWSARTFIHAIQSCKGFQLAMMSASLDDPNNVCQLFDDLQKGPGDQIKYDLISRLTGEGVSGDNEIEGNEEAPNSYQDSFVINQLRHAVKPKGAMSQQRVPFSLREKAKMLLQDWWSERWDLSLFNQLCGNASQTNVKYTGHNAVTGPTGIGDVDQTAAGHMVIANSRTAESALVSGDSFTLAMITKAVTNAQTLARPIRPLQLKGLELNGIAFIHPLQARSLRNNYTTGEWGDIQLAAMKGGEITGNPIFTGALGMIDGTLIHVASRAPWGSLAQFNSGLTLNPLQVGGAGGLGENIARGVFVGAQAVAMGFGRAYDTSAKLKWVEESLDANNQLRVTAGCVYGMKKTIFNSEDYGTITLSSFELGR